jgi:hypothetical protein
MSETYIKNRGVTETIIHDNHRDRVSQIKWEANYNGDSANIHLVANDGGPTEHYSVQLTNEDLANMLNIPSDKASLEDQLAEYRSPRRNKLTHISTPRSDEELIVPNMTRRSKTLRAYKIRRKPKTRRRNRTSSIRRNLKRTLNSWL